MSSASIPSSPPLMKPASLDQYEVGGVISIFIKTFKADRRMEELTKIIEASQTELAALKLSRAKGANALSIYGFDPGAPGIWKAVREVIGDEQYFRAIAIAQGKEIPPPGVVAEMWVKEREVDASLAGQREGPGSEGAEPERPKISDAILAFLKDSGSSGVRVAAVKEHLSRAYGIETHEKTPGMTLYRLLKEGKATRSGRNWFYFDPASSGKKENPGGETPGHNDRESEKETAEC